MAEIDHLVIGAATLEAGAAYLERHLGTRPVPGGPHPGAGTHNMLLGLGPDQYIEIIAPDPNQAPPAHPRP
ncbi:MAG: VOC family protein, partial [Roseomonas sp.]|nr:VOC family protein [Roseomonas sp.]